MQGRNSAEIRTASRVNQGVRWAMAEQAVQGATAEQAALGAMAGGLGLSTRPGPYGRRHIALPPNKCFFFFFLGEQLGVSMPGRILE